MSASAVFSIFQSSVLFPVCILLGDKQVSMGLAENYFDEDIFKM